MSKTIEKAKAKKAATKQDYDEALKSYSKAYREAQVLTQKKDAKLADLKEQYGKPIQAQEDAMSKARDVIQEYCEQNREEMFGANQSFKNWLGTIGFRKAPPSVVLPAGDAGKNIVALLRKKGLDAYILIKEEVDKKAILKDCSDPKAMKKLEAIGVNIETENESFYIKAD